MNALFVSLIMAGAALAGVASQKASAEPAHVASAAVVRASDVFKNLVACEVPGLHEHLLAKGIKTLVYAGEFTPTVAVPWTSAKARIVLYIVSGSGIVSVGNVRTTAHAGDVFILPKDKRHAVSATSGKLRAFTFEDRT